MAGNEPMRLSSEDFYTPRVEGYLEEQAVLTRAVPEAEPQPLFTRIVYSSWFYLAIAGMIGALIAWIPFEPYMREGDNINSRSSGFVDMLLFPSVAAVIGLFLGVVEGAVCRNVMRAMISGLVGLSVGFVAGLITYVGARLIFGTMIQIAIGISHPTREDPHIHGFGFLILMMGRGAAWAVAAIAAGVGQGIAVRDRKVAVNGIVGGVLGGLIGGILFDPIGELFSTVNATASRGVGFAVIGLSVGLFIGLVESWTKSAWLLMKAGPLAGKQFILFRNPTVVGSSPKCDVYLFKDAAIEPKHALIHERGGRFEIEDCGTADGTYINGRPVQKKILAAGDQIVIGKTVFEFALRDKN